MLNLDIEILHRSYYKYTNEFTKGQNLLISYWAEEDYYCIDLEFCTPDDDVPKILNFIIICKIPDHNPKNTENIVKEIVFNDVLLDQYVSSINEKLKRSFNKEELLDVEIVYEPQVKYPNPTQIQLLKLSEYPDVYSISLLDQS